jgi:tRNA pseudouridine55 synthase
VRHTRGKPTPISMTMTTDRSNADQGQSGIVVIDKPAGWTSHQVVAKIRRIAGTRKVGHAGTLDPMATGVLVVGIGRATRLLGYLALTEKAYEATIRLGITTLSDDAEGEVTAAVGAHTLSDDQIEPALAGLRGELMQVPSAVSAIKVEGVRSYAKVRSGQEVALAPRPVTIRRFEVVGRHDQEVDGIAAIDLDVVVECSSGTYVRALARDLGITLGTGAHLTALRRTRVEPFTLGQAQTLEEAERGLTILSMEDVVRSSFATLSVNQTQANYIRNGRRLAGVTLPDRTTALVDEAGSFLALYRQEGPDAIAQAVFTRRIR